MLKGFCMLEDSTIHTCKVRTLATFHSIYMNLGLNAGEAKIKIIQQGGLTQARGEFAHRVGQVRPVSKSRETVHGQPEIK